MKMRKRLLLMAYGLCLSLIIVVLISTTPSAAITTEKVEIHPETLNLESKGRWITVLTSLPEEYELSDINVTTVRLGIIPAAWGKVEGNKLMVKFDRQMVIDYIWAYKLYHMQIPLPQEGVEVDLTLSGELYDGTPFEGSGTIRVILRG